MADCIHYMLMTQATKLVNTLLELQLNCHSRVTTGPAKKATPADMAHGFLSPAVLLLLASHMDYHTLGSSQLASFVVRKEKLGEIP